MLVQILRLHFLYYVYQFCLAGKNQKIVIGHLIVLTCIGCKKTNTCLNSIDIAVVSGFWKRKWFVFIVLELVKKGLEDSYTGALLSSQIRLGRSRGGGDRLEDSRLVLDCYTDLVWTCYIRGQWNSLCLYCYMWTRLIPEMDMKTP